MSFEAQEGTRIFWQKYMTHSRIIFVQRIDAGTLGAALALSSGALIYVGATHLLPQAEREPRRFSLVALGAGILMAVVIVASK